MDIVIRSEQQALYVRKNVILMILLPIKQYMFIFLKQLAPMSVIRKCRYSKTSFQFYLWKYWKQLFFDKLKIVATDSLDILVDVANDCNECYCTWIQNHKEKNLFFLEILA